MKNKYPGLVWLGSYLNQDFMYEFGSADNAILAYKKDSASEGIEKSKKELHEIIQANYDEKMLEELLNQLGSCYYYQSEWKSAKDWLHHVQEVLNQ